ncbi:MAG: dipicolinate synthase subunit B [Oscillospiraceae bacterium]
MSKKKLGFVITGSFCTFSTIIPYIEKLTNIYDVYPIMSFNVSEKDTRFFKSQDFKDKIIEITGKRSMDKITEVEPLGPKQILDVLAVCPCTGNTMSKIANGISDTPASLAVKSHLRNQRPVVIAVSTNDALSGNARNLGVLLNAKNIYFVPFAQDDCINKPTSLVAKFEFLEKSIEDALIGHQSQPLLY